MAAPADLSQALVAGPVAARDWIAVLPVVVPLLAAALLMMMRHAVRWHPPLAYAALLLNAVLAFSLLRRTLEEGPFSITMGSWLPPFGISFTVDVLGAALALTATSVALLCSVAALGEINATGRRYGFYPFLMLLMAGVSGAFLTGDIFNLYVWFEVFVIASFGLIVLGSEKAQIDGAIKYAFLNLIGTTLFLIATGYLYGIFGTLNMADIARKAPQLAGEAPLGTLASLYLLAFGMKAAAFPVNFWLPASYHTPPMVTAALFGAILTKIGVYALLRTLVMLLPGAAADLSAVVGVVAFATVLFGSLGALAQSDFRRMLGFLVISGVGVMLTGLALGGAALAGTVLYAVHSMLATAGLYLLASLMFQRGGSWSLHELGGLWRSDPLISTLALLLFLALAGLPPGSGLWPKVMLLSGAVEQGASWMAAAVLLNGFLTTIALGRVFALAFWRERPVLMAAAPRASKLVLAPVVLLTAGTVALGVWPEPAVRIAQAAAGGLIDPAPYIEAVFPRDAP